jgi:hypothetical protein
MVLRATNNSIDTGQSVKKVLTCSWFTLKLEKVTSLGLYY